MSYSSKAYLAYEERRLEPDAVIRTGNSRRHTTTRAAKNKWIDSLTDEQREQLRLDHENELKRIEQWK